LALQRAERLNVTLPADLFLAAEPRPGQMQTLPLEWPQLAKGAAPIGCNAGKSGVNTALFKRRHVLCWRNLPLALTLQDRAFPVSGGRKP
jgi:hypothetical protein